MHDPRQLLEAFLTPPKTRELSREQDLLAQSECYNLVLGGSGFARGGGDVVHVYHWGEGPSALLVHGWGSRAAHFDKLITALTKAGWRVVAFDAPGHGRSGGTLSSAPAFASAIRALADQCEPFEAVVAHSLGAVAISLVLGESLRARKAVLLSSCCRVEPLAVAFARNKGATDDTVREMLEVARTQFRPQEVSADVSAVAFGHVPALLMHDPADGEMPYNHSLTLAAAWPGAVLVDIPGVGHRRILRVRNIVDRTLQYLMDR